MIKDVFEPKVREEYKNKLVSTYLDNKELPVIEMKIENELQAKAVFNFYLRISNQKLYFKRSIIGPSRLVYKTAARICKRVNISFERAFQHQWNRTLQKFLENTDNKNNQLINLGVFTKKLKKENSFGLYNIKTPGELLEEKIIENDIKGKDLANMAGIAETTLYRHLKNEIQIDKNTAINYGKILGCDPVDLMFNPLFVSVWGTVDTLQYKSINKNNILHCEITENFSDQTAECPRHLYRPDVKAIKIDQPESMYHNQVAFYYENNADQNYEGKLSIVSSLIKERYEDVTKLRYFFGIVEKSNKPGLINIICPDPKWYDFVPDADEHMNTFDDLTTFMASTKYVVEDIPFESISPVVSMVRQDFDQTAKPEIIKAYDKFYLSTRKEEIEEIENLRKLRLRAALEGRLTNSLTAFFEASKYHTEDVIEKIAQQKVQKLASYSDAFRTAISKIGKGVTKIEKKNHARQTLRQIEDLSQHLSKDEENIVSAAHDSLLEEIEMDEYQNSELSEAANG